MPSVHFAYKRMLAITVGAIGDHFVYCRSGNFRVIKFSCFKFPHKNIFMVQDTHEKFLTVLHSQV